MIFALGACERISASVVLSSPGRVVLAYCSAAATAFSHELVDSRTQVSMIETKPTSFPPIVILTRVVDELSDDSWLLMTSPAVASEHAANVKDAGLLAAVHRAG